MSSPNLNREMMDILMRKLPKAVGVEVCRVDGVATRMSAYDDTLEVQFRLPVTYGTIKTTPRMNYAGSADIVDMVLYEMHRTASEMRGLAMRDLLDSELSIDIASSRNMSETEACERYGTRLVEMGEELLRRVKESK